ncbi:glycosyltransferase family 4 protein [Vulcanisaeta souniana]|uniref:Glycosyl transferase family 1 domain-containing protein n=1 Tax=Vulcanisaeta souniana JCM 11219 TaxID=1293586 RepID=A0A830EM34_9CREN|nr:glycosyltransferase family 4 protein [Vulcanisaeta souniana]BDR92688.1 hypothetical protein Vsou_17810 [Vulcanisaeta souniana JCM 11219]GGI84386.1 hypothetical protein GCM10007112_21670 [Vulcanisaeta souniana JCM 11219]
MHHATVITIVPGVVNGVMIKKDPVCIPYGFARLGFRSVLVVGKALVRIPGVEVYELGLINPRRGRLPLYIYNALNSLASVIYYGVRLVGLLIRERPLFVLTYYSPTLLPILYFLGRVLGFRVVVKMDWDGVIRGNRIKRVVRALSLAFFSRFVNLMIIESYEALLNAVRFVPSLYSRLRVVYNGWCREVLGGGLSNERGKIVLTVARVEPVKGIHDLIRAFSLVAGKHGDWVLRIVGPVTDKDYFNELRRLVGELGLDGRVEFVGAVSDSELVREYRHASIFVLPSYLESFGIARIEALAFGLPVITTRTGGSEIVRGVGVIVEPGDVHNLANALDRLMSNEDLRRELSLRALERVQSLTYEAVCMRIIKEIMNV